MVVLSCSGKILHVLWEAFEYQKYRSACRLINFYASLCILNLKSFYNHNYFDNVKGAKMTAKSIIYICILQCYWFR